MYCPNASRRPGQAGIEKRKNRENRGGFVLVLVLSKFTTYKHAKVPRCFSNKRPGMSAPAGRRSYYGMLIITRVLAIISRKVAKG